jgi:hypothetical protein
MDQHAAKICFRDVLATAKMGRGPPTIPLIFYSFVCRSLKKRLQLFGIVLPSSGGFIAFSHPLKFQKLGSRDVSYQKHLKLV